MTIKKAFLAIALLVLAYVVATPYIAVYQIKTAAKERNGEKLADYVDFPSVREHLKSDLKAKFMDSVLHGGAPNHPLAIFGSVFADTIINKMVDAYMTPSGVIHMMAGHPPEIVLDGETPAPAAPKEAPFQDANMTYESLSKFVVTAKSSGTSTEVNQFVLRHRGLGWQLTEIIFDAKP